MSVEPPEHLRPVERDAWTDVVEALGPAAEAAPLPALEALACQVARMRDARRRIEAEGEIVLDARDRPVPHPALTIERQAQSEVRAWISTLAPRSGAPAAAAPAPKAATSPLDQLAQRRAKSA